MIDISGIEKRANKALKLSFSYEFSRKFLVERASRVAASCRYISRIDEVRELDVNIDIDSLLVAAYFTYTGLAKFLKENNGFADLALISEKNQLILDYSIEEIKDSLKDTLKKDIIEKSSRIIIESSENNPIIIEAKILSDARNLDEIGAVGIINEIREIMCSGRSVTNFLKSWQSKIDYGYWQARINESFHFDTVKKLAEQRFSSADFFVKQLLFESQCRDIKGIVADVDIDRQAYAKTEEILD